MKKVVAVVVLIVAVIALKPRLMKLIDKGAGSDAVSKGRTRVEAMLGAWKKGGTSTSIDAQTAMCQWYQGVNVLSDRDQLAAASDRFDAFRRQKDLYREIGSYSVDSAEETARKTATVHCTIDGQKYDLIVPEDEPIRWAS